MVQWPDHHYQVVERQGRGFSSQYSRPRKRRRGCADNTILPASRMRGRPAQQHHHTSSTAPPENITCATTAAASLVSGLKGMPGLQTMPSRRRQSGGRHRSNTSPTRSSTPPLVNHPTPRHQPQLEQSEAEHQEAQQPGNNTGGRTSRRLELA
jgi:hypothetical protein